MVRVYQNRVTVGTRKLKKSASGCTGGAYRFSCGIRRACLHARGKSSSRSLLQVAAVLRSFRQTNHATKQWQLQRLRSRPRNQTRRASGLRRRIPQRGHDCQSRPMIRRFCGSVMPKVARRSSSGSWRWKMSCSPRTMWSIRSSRPRVVFPRSFARCVVKRYRARKTQLSSCTCTSRMARRLRRDSSAFLRGIAPRISSRQKRPLRRFPACKAISKP